MRLRARGRHDGNPLVNDIDRALDQLVALIERQRGRFRRRAVDDDAMRSVAHLKLQQAGIGIEIDLAVAERSGDGWIGTHQKIGVERDHILGGGLGGFRGWIEIGRAPSELQSLMRISYAVFCLKKKKTDNN